MKYFIQFYKKDANGNLTEALGSDSVRVVDGRLSFDNMKLVGFKHAKMLKNIKRFDAFCIMKGDLKVHATRSKSGFFFLDYDNSLYLIDSLKGE